MAAVHTITVMLTGTWRMWMWPFSKGEASRRVGWSTSWASGSMPSSPAMNMPRPATTTSGVVPVHAPRRAAPATTASKASRAIRAAGQRSTPWKPRTTMGARPVPLTRMRIHGPPTGQLEGQLATQEHDGAQVLQRGGEAELADEGGAPLGGLQRGGADDREPDEDQDQRDDRGDQPERVELRAATGGGARRAR